LPTPFQFKQFAIHQDACAMKVGTDSVLLGAWTSLKHEPNTILDIGAGTGILALMMAQRSNAENIEAIEINADAYEQCVSNFEISSWADRLFCYHADLDELVAEMEIAYDLIIANPPYFTENNTTKNTARDLARRNDALPFSELIKSVAKLLSPTGEFAVIIPHKEFTVFTKLAQNQNLFANRVTHVRGTASSPIKRTLLQLSFTETSTPTEILIVEEVRHTYTNAYTLLTKDFYLKM